MVITSLFLHQSIVVIWVVNCLCRRRLLYNLMDISVSNMKRRPKYKRIKKRDKIMGMIMIMSMIMIR